MKPKECHLFKTLRMFLGNVPIGLIVKINIQKGREIPRTEGSSN